MATANKYGLRAAATERRNRHAQRTPLPPRPGTLETVREIIEMGKGLARPLPAGAGGVQCGDCGTSAAADGKGTPIVLKHKKGCPERKRAKKAEKAAAAEAPEVVATAPKAKQAPGGKAAAFTADAHALGWGADHAIKDAAVRVDTVTVSRGDESIVIEWQNEVFVPPCIYRRPDGSTSKLNNASAARKQMALPPPTAQQMAARKAVRSSSGDAARIPVREIPLDLATTSDAELESRLAGCKLVWVNSISQQEESDTIPPRARVRISEEFGGRTVHFNGPTGARSVRLSSIIHVGGMKRIRVAS